MNNNFMFLETEVQKICSSSTKKKLKNIQNVVFNGMTWDSHDSINKIARQTLRRICSGKSFFTLNPGSQSPYNYKYSHNNSPAEGQISFIFSSPPSFVQE